MEVCSRSLETSKPETFSSPSQGLIVLQNPDFSKSSFLLKSGPWNSQRTNEGQIDKQNTHGNYNRICPKFVAEHDRDRENRRFWRLF